MIKLLNLVILIGSASTGATVAPTLADFRPAYGDERPTPADTAAYALRCQRALTADERPQSVADLSPWIEDARAALQEFKITGEPVRFFDENVEHLARIVHRLSAPRPLGVTVGEWATVERLRADLTLVLKYAGFAPTPAELDALRADIDQQAAEVDPPPFVRERIARDWALLIDLGEMIRLRTGQAYAPTISRAAMLQALTTAVPHSI